MNTSEMPCSPTIWFETARQLLALLPNRSMRLDDEGYAAFEAAGLTRYRADATVTGLRWKDEVEANRDEEGVMVLRLREDEEERHPQQETPYQSEVPPPPASDAQKNYLKLLGYPGATGLTKPIEQLSLYDAGRAIKRLKRTADIKSQAEKLFPPKPPRAGQKMVLVTEELMEQLRTPKGGYRSSTTRMLGIGWPLPRAWRQAIVGRSIPIDPKQLEEEIRINQRVAA